MAMNGAPLADHEVHMQVWMDLGAGVWVRQSRAFQMNSVALLDPAHAVLVDPGVLPSEIDDIAARVRAIGPAAVTLVMTHAHWDHVLGRAHWPAARVIAHDRFAADLERTMQWVDAEAGKIGAEHGEKYARSFEPFRANERVSGQHFSRIGPWRVVFRDAFGHSDSQLSLHLPEQRVLIAADMLSDIEIPTLNVPAPIYLATLGALEPLFTGGAVETLIPGHGTVAHGHDVASERLRRDLAYLETLDREVGAARRAGVSLAETRQRLAGMPDVERHADFPMREIHERNITLTYGGTEAARAGS
jgi:glyoxylase-like metal-dependent hydrolase (beta-lactamase superfamily II)